MNDSYDNLFNEMDNKNRDVKGRYTLDLITGEDEDIGMEY